MTSKSSVTYNQKFTDPISLSVAVTLVSYSRDYIGRLAREGRVAARQIDKQWFVSRESLLNFFEHSAVEDSVKKKILSQSRKNDLEVKDFYKVTISKINGRTTNMANLSLLATVLIIAGGLCGGLLLNTQAAAFTEGENFQLAQVFQAFTTAPHEVSSEVANVSAAVFSETVVIESQEKIPMDGGVVLFPTLNAKEGESVTALFSDDVTVVITSTTTGFVRTSDGGKELPFVRIPNTSE